MSTDSPKKKRGFAAMMPEQRRAISVKGGKARYASGRGHLFTIEEARSAGRKGAKRARELGVAHKWTQEEAAAAGAKARRRNMKRPAADKHLKRQDG